MGRDDNAPKGLGAALIVDAARRVSRITALGIWGLMLDAENDGLVAWYEKIGFKRARPLKDGPPSKLMYGPLKSFLRCQSYNH